MDKQLKLLIKLSPQNRDLLDAASAKVGLSRAKLVNLAVQNFLQKPESGNSVEARLNRMFR